GRETAPARPGISRAIQPGQSQSAVLHSIVCESAHRPEVETRAEAEEGDGGAREGGLGMAVARTTRGYQVRWYDMDGHFKKKTFKGITRDEAVRLEREILAARDRGERQPELRTAPLFGTF